MGENEYKDNEKVLYKTRGKLSLPHKKPEEAEILLTEGHVVIETREPIKIPMLRIRNFHISADYYQYGYGMDGALGRVMLIYYDASWRRQEIDIEMHPGDAAMLGAKLSLPLPIDDKVLDFAAQLKAIGVDSEPIQASHVVRGYEESVTIWRAWEVPLARTLDWVTTIGSLQPVDTHINRIHVVEIYYTESTGGHAVDLPNKSYGVDFIAATEYPVQVSCFGKPKKRYILFGGVINYRWQGDALADWLAQDTELNEMLKKANAPEIKMNGNHICVRGWKLPSGKVFPCIDRIAEYICKKARR